MRAGVGESSLDLVDGSAETRRAGNIAGQSDQEVCIEACIRGFDLNLFGDPSRSIFD